MQHRICLALLVALGGVAHADVELLRSVPSVVAVSSTVDNAKIVPEHLVDGQLTTAWNSRTDDLVRAWIAFRVPADVRVMSIKLTVGFTSVDKKLGDLFTMNPRIKKVAITHNQVRLRDVALDPDNRALQTIPINATGGEFQITVLEIVPGTKKAWREISISELEVWGTPGKTAPGKATRPAVRVGSLDAPPALRAAECIKAAFPAAKRGRIGDEVIGKAVAFGLTTDTTICRVDRQTKGADASTAEIVAVARASRTVLGRTTVALTNSAGPTFDDPGNQEDNATTSDVALSAFPLTTGETALLVVATQKASGMHANSGKDTTTLYRVSAQGLDDILTFESTWSQDVEGGKSDRCKLVPPRLGATLPAALSLACESTQEDWHNEDPSLRGDNRVERTDTATWNGTSYDYTKP